MIYTIPILNISFIHFPLTGWENVIFELRSERVNVKVLTKSGAITVHRRISASAISFPVLTSKKGACTIETRRSKNFPPNSRRMTVKGPVTFRVDGFIDRRTAETLSSSYEELRAPTAVLLSF